jgi:hypothetical protein
MTKSKLDSIFFILLSCFSFGGVVGRVFSGIAIIDILILLTICYLVTSRPSTLKIRKRTFVIFLVLLVIGFLPKFLSGPSDDFRYFNIETRLYIYLPIITFIGYNLILDFKYIKRILPFFLCFFLIIWLMDFPGSPVFHFFNTKESFVELAGDLRINGPTAIGFMPVFLILIQQRIQNLGLLFLYVLLVTIEFVKSGGRTYFLFEMVPLFYFTIKNVGKVRRFVFILFVLTMTFFVIRSVSSDFFIDRLFNVANATEDHSFNYRILNIAEMLDRIYRNQKIVFGNGFGFKYDVNLFGWKRSFFLDNTYITLVYKTGVFGLVCFVLLFYYNLSKTPDNIILIYLGAIFIIGFVSYHLILNPVFLFQYICIGVFYHRQVNEGS